MESVLVTGGCGYMGSILIPKLLLQGYKVKVIDTQWFGSFLIDHPNLSIIKEDIRNFNDKYLENVKTIIHLANVANDPAVELNPTMSWEINVLASQQIADSAIRSGVKEIIYASSGSVYGIKNEEKVTEDLTLVPISTYNKTKMVAERVFLSYKDKMRVFCIRPATVCGLSPRMRLDVAVNLLTFQALKFNEITVLGGNQVRPNIHIDDITDLYLHLMDQQNLKSDCFNAGFENISILDIAKKIQTKTNCRINIKESNDPRSYRQDSSKILLTGFKPKKNVDIAIEEIIDAYKSGKLIDSPSSYTVKWMKANKYS